MKDYRGGGLGRDGNLDMLLGIRAIWLVAFWWAYPGWDDMSDRPERPLLAHL